MIINIIIYIFIKFPSKGSSSGADSILVSLELLFSSSPSSTWVIFSFCSSEIFIGIIYSKTIIIDYNVKIIIHFLEKLNWILIQWKKPCHFKNYEDFNLIKDMLIE